MYEVSIDIGISCVKKIFNHFFSAQIVQNRPCRYRLNRTDLHLLSLEKGHIVLTENSSGIGWMRYEHDGKFFLCILYLELVRPKEGREPYVQVCIYIYSICCMNIIYKIYFYVQFFFLSIYTMYLYM